jgi:hypothetical protein
MRVTRLHWTHPDIGRIDEVVCPTHDTEVRDALRTLGMGSISSDGSVRVEGADGPGELATCLRCQAHPAKLPRELLRQWFGDDR